MVKYIGSKRLLVPVIERLARRLPITTACDLFAGTTRVGQGLRRAGLTVHSNDLATYSEALGHAYIAAGDSLDRGRLQDLLEHLRALPPEHGYFTETFCIRSRFFQPHNGGRIDAIRNEIERLALSALERGALLTSLMEAADRVDSTCGLQMAYLKRWAARSFNDLELREPRAVPGPAGTVTRLDANDLAGQLDGCDCAYLDPPYNQHSYYSNYHVWETLVRWDRPPHYGVACKRIDCRTTKSPYNSRREAWRAFSGLIERLPTPWIVASLSDEGFHDLDRVAALLSEKGHLRSVAIDFRRYVGAQIGIFNPSGRKVGAVSHLRNRELLFVVGPDEAAVEAAVDRLPASAPGAVAGAPAARS
ncbi:MAG: DNA adenine methylase [Acidobacteriota bacterium]|nr:DNA adenine methylase [Acidobacteriota bacterium]